jgi:hypothetical protein
MSIMSILKRLQRTRRPKSKYEQFDVTDTDYSIKDLHVMYHSSHICDPPPVGTWVFEPGDACLSKAGIVLSKVLDTCSTDTDAGIPAVLSMTPDSFTVTNAITDKIILQHSPHIIPVLGRSHCGVADFGYITCCVDLKPGDMELSPLRSADRRYTVHVFKCIDEEQAEYIVSECKNVFYEILKMIKQKK